MKTFLLLCSMDGMWPKLVLTTHEREWRDLIPELCERVGSKSILHVLNADTKHYCLFPVHDILFQNSFSVLYQRIWKYKPLLVYLWKEPMTGRKQVRYSHGMIQQLSQLSLFRSVCASAYESYSTDSITDFRAGIERRGECATEGVQYTLCTQSTVWHCTNST